MSTQPKVYGLADLKPCPPKWAGDADGMTPDERDDKLTALRRQYARVYAEAALLDKRLGKRRIWLEHTRSAITSLVNCATEYAPRNELRAKGSARGE